MDRQTRVDFIETPNRILLMCALSLLLLLLMICVDRRRILVEPQEDYHLPRLVLVVPSRPANTNPGARWVECVWCCSAVGR